MRERSRLQLVCPTVYRVHSAAPCISVAPCTSRLSPAWSRPEVDHGHDEAPKQKRQNRSQTRCEAGHGRSAPASQGSGPAGGRREPDHQTPCCRIRRHPEPVSGPGHGCRFARSGHQPPSELHSRTRLPCGFESLPLHRHRSGRARPPDGALEGHPRGLLQRRLQARLLPQPRIPDGPGLRQRPAQPRPDPRGRSGSA